MNAFIPRERGNIVIIDSRASSEIIENLKKLDLKVIKTQKCKSVDDSIAYHPDIVIHPIDRNTLVIAPEVYDYYVNKLKNYNFRLIKGDKFLSKKYPNDISYNVARIGNIALHKTENTDYELKKQLASKSIELIDIKQGYSKCSLALLGHDIAITSDIPMYKVLEEKGYKVLLISPGNIDLPGQNYGFIGGALGNLTKNIVLVSGNLDYHPDGDRIKMFADANNKKLIYLSNEKLFDFGTILVLEDRREIFG